jgi:hypothetical protein
VETALQLAGSAVYRETVEMQLQPNSELALSEPRYSGGLLYVLQATGRDTHVLTVIYTVNQL